MSTSDVGQSMTVLWESNSRNSKSKRKRVSEPLTPPPDSPKPTKKQSKPVSRSTVKSTTASKKRKTNANHKKNSQSSNRANKSTSPIQHQSLCVATHHSRAGPVSYPIEGNITLKIAYNILHEEALLTIVQCNNLSQPSPSQTDGIDNNTTPPRSYKVKACMFSSLLGSSSANSTSTTTTNSSNDGSDSAVEATKRETKMVKQSTPLITFHEVLRFPISPSSLVELPHIYFAIEVWDALDNFVGQTFAPLTALVRHNGLVTTTLMAHDTRVSCCSPTQSSAASTTLWLSDAEFTTANLTTPTWHTDTLLARAQTNTNLASVPKSVAVSVAKTNGQYHSITLSVESCPHNVCVDNYLGVTLKPHALGLEVVSVDQTAFAAECGLRSFDIVTSMNGGDDLVGFTQDMLVGLITMMGGCVELSLISQQQSVVALNTADAFITNPTNHLTPPTSPPFHPQHKQAVDTFTNDIENIGVDHTNSTTGSDTNANDDNANDKSTIVNDDDDDDSNTEELHDAFASIYGESGGQMLFESVLGDEPLGFDYTTCAF